MNYEDASQAGSMDTGSAPTARADVEALPPGSFGPANGNVITGAGTTSGASGADSVADAPAKIVEVHGSGGPTAAQESSFQAAGQFGVLNMDAQGNFNYVRNPGTPDGAQDVFGYTLADRDGSTSSTTLTIDIGRMDPAALAAAQGVVNLPAGVDPSDITVSGRDLIIHMPDGTQMVIPGGAVFVPQLVIGDTELPASTLAQLLIDSEPKPAAGLVPSSGGPPPPPVPTLDPGVPLGDLIPPTELSYTPPEFEEIAQGEDDEPEIVIIPDGQPAAVNAVDSVDEAGLPTRPGEPEGSGEEAAAGADGDTSEHTSGVISIDTGNDNIESVTINGVEITTVGQEIAGEQGTLRITSINFDTGQIGYIYTLTDNTNPGGDNISDFFEVIVTDDDGDTATGTLTIDIIDDTPIARDDTDAVNEGASSTDGNVITGAGTTSGAAGHDTSGADGLHGETNGAIDGVTAVQAGTSTVFDGSDAVAQNGAGKVVDGTFGTLTIHNDGSYSYVLHEDVGDGGTDVFTYQITDGDGDTDTATLTITVPSNPNEPPIVALGDAHVSEEGLQGGIIDDEPNPILDTTNSPSASGDVITSDPDGDPTTAVMGEPSQTLYSGGTEIEWTVSDGGHTLTGSAGGNDIIVVTIEDNGHYEVLLKGPVDHPDDTIEDTVDFTIPVTVSDGTVDVPTSIKVTIEDDSPTASTPQGREIPTLVVDESPVGEDEGGDNDPAGVRSATADFSGNFVGGSYGADGPGTTEYSLSLSSEGAHSGLFALGANGAKGAEILLYTDGDNIVGKVGSDVYFTISVDPEGTDAGKVTFEQADGMNVWHSDTGSDDDTSSLSAAEGTIELVQTITDNDGDHASSLIDLSDGVFNIEDDGPTAATPDTEGLPTLVVDESPVGEDEGGDNDPAGVRSASADFSGAFSGGGYGTDGPGTTEYSLNLSSEGAHSGLFALGVDGAKGAEILLYTDGDTIVGKVGTDVYFTISVDPEGTDAGTVTFEQANGMNVWHSDTGSDDDTSYLSAEPGTIELVQTITDADGDQDTASIDLSDDIFQIEDDGPTAGTANPEGITPLVVDESPVGEDEGGDNDPAGVRSASADFSGAFSGGSYGTDGPGTTEYSLNLSSEGAHSGLFALGVDGAKGEEILLYTDGDNIVGKVGTDVYFTISVEADGFDAGKVTFEQADGMNVWHSDTGSDDDTSSLSAAEGTITLDQTITDADGDSETASVDLSDGVFQIEDDGPTAATPDTSELPTLVVDESPVGEDEGGDNDPAGVRSASADFSGHFTGGSYGTDGPGTTEYSLNLSSEGAHSGLFALGVDGAKGAEILLYTDGDTIVGKVGSDVYFTISVDADGPTAGTVTFEQADGMNVWHSDTTDFDDTSTLSAAEGTITLDQVITDADGDTDTASIDLSDGIFNIEDDGPSTFTPDSAVVENDTGTVTGVSLDIDDGDLTENYGTDGPGTVRFPSSLEGTSSGLTSSLQPIVYHVSADGLTLYGYVEDGTNDGFQDGEDSTILTVTLDPATSTYSVEMSGHVDATTNVQFNEAGYTFVGGNDPWSGFTSPDADSQDLLITPMFNDVSDSTTNTSSISGGVGSGNEVGAGEAVRLDYVIDLGGNPAKAGGSGDYSDGVNQDHTFDSHYVTNGAFASFSATNPGTSTILIKAFDDYNSADSNNSGTDGNDLVGDGDLDTITAISISFKGGDALLITADGTYTVNEGTADERSYTVDFEADGTVTVEDVYGTGGANADETTIAVFTDDGYTSLEFHYVSGEEFKIGNFGAAVESTDPVPVSIPVEIVDADGDVVAGTDIDLSIVPEGSLSTLSTLSLQSSETLSKSFDTSSLIATNDNHQQKDAFKTGSDPVLMGALAAAGLGSTSQVAAHDYAATSGLADTADQGSKVKLTGEIKASGESGHRDGLMGIHQQSDDPKHAAESSSSSANDRVADTSLTDAHDAPAAAPTELLQGSDAPVADNAAHSAITSQAIYVPSAEMLAAHGGKGEGKGVDARGAEAQSSDADVGKVLADALHGGGQGPDVEALVNALGGDGQEGGKAGLAALASHGHGAVPNGDMGALAAFAGGHGMLSMEHMTMHQDAAPQHG